MTHLKVIVVQENSKEETFDLLCDDQILTADDGARFIQTCIAVAGPTLLAQSRKLESDVYTDKIS